MQDQVVRVSESRYGKGFVIFQVALPINTSYFLLCKLCKFWEHWSANFCFCQRKPELPRFFISYHNSIRTELYHITSFQFGITHTKTHFQPLKLPNCCLFCKVRKMPFFQRATKPHINKAKLQVTPIVRE